MRVPFFIVATAALLLTACNGPGSGSNVQANSGDGNTVEVPCPDPRRPNQPCQ